LNCVVLAVAHNEFKDNINFDFLDSLYVDDKKVLIDIKNMIDKKECELKGYIYWSL